MAEVAGGSCAQGVAPGGLYGGLDQPCPGQCGIQVGRYRERGHDAGGGDRAGADRHRHPTAVVGDQVPDAAPEPAGITSATGHLDVSVDDDRVTLDGPHGDKGTAAEADD